jgi:hypothetical protein
MLVGISRAVSEGDEHQCLIVRHLQRRRRLIYQVRSDTRYAMLCVPVGDKNKQFSKFKRTLRLLTFVQAAFCSASGWLSGKSAEISLMMFCVEFGIAKLTVAAFISAYFFESESKV